MNDCKKLNYRLRLSALESTETPRSILHKEMIENIDVFIKCNFNVKRMKDKITGIRQKIILPIQQTLKVPKKSNFYIRENYFIFMILALILITEL
jgi:hypothetical protein